MPTPKIFRYPDSVLLGAVGVSGTQALGLLVLLTYLVSPLLWQAWLVGWAGWRDPLMLFSAITTLLWLAVGHCLCRRPWWLHLAILPLYVTTAVDLFLLWAFRTRLSSGYATIALTDYSETGEFLASYAWPVSVSALGLIMLYLPSLYAIKSLRMTRFPRSAALVSVLLLVTYSLAIARELRGGTSADQAVLSISGYEHSTPMGAVFQIALALRLNQINGELRARRADRSLSATRVESAVADEVYVWVVGESARPNDWSLFGYERDTNPTLRAIKGVIAFPNMLTTAPHTSVAVPSMLSLSPITDWPAVLAQPSIVEAFNEVGFKTYWLSAQAADSWAGVIPQMAAEASRRRYFEQGHDGAMLPTLQAVLDDAPKGSKLFIVLHTRGSHFEYSRRYPSDFAHFNTAGGTRRDQIVDSYDNSILYTDWFLGQVIEMLARRKTRSVLMYASDHGENLLDDGRQLLGHALGTRYDLHTAAFVWLSDAMRADHAQQIENAQRSAGDALSLSNLSHSMLDLAGIRAAGLDPKMSVFSAAFVEHPRSYIVRGELRHEAASVAQKR